MAMIGRGKGSYHFLETLASLKSRFEFQLQQGQNEAEILVT